MSFLKKIFGPTDPLGGVRRAQQQGRWADALALGEGVDRSVLDAAAQQELDRLLAAAGDALAELNLTEGDACMRSGDTARALEHFRLAAAQARSQVLAAAASERLEPSQSHFAAVAEPVASIPGCGSHCRGTSPAQVTEETDPLDYRTRLELTVAAYPAELAARYSRFDGPLLEAFLLAHDGHGDEALASFDQVPPGQRDDLFHFERGALLARAGRGAEAVADLERALARNPGHLLALETLIDLEMKIDQNRAEERLRRMLADGLAPAFAHGRLAILLARQNRPEEALQHARQALAVGGDADILIVAATLLEKLGRPAEAEALLLRLPSGGCGGGSPPSLPLAEFWLRQGKNLDRALDAFAAALRQDGHPRWRLNIAQVYLARGWRKEARSLLEQVLATTPLDAEIDHAARSLLRAVDPGST